MNLLTKTIAATGLSLLANAAGAEEPPALTIDKMAADLALPITADAFYFNRALNVAIKERCDKDANDPNTIRCTVDARSNLGLLTLRQQDSYTVTNGALTIASTTLEARGWGGYDKNNWQQYSKAATPGDLTGTPMAAALTAGGVKLTQEGLLPQNDIFAVGKNATDVTLSSLAPAGTARTFSLSLTFDAATQRVSMTSLTRAVIGADIVDAQTLTAGRAWSRGDQNFYDKYQAMESGFGLRQ